MDGENKVANVGVKTAAEIPNATAGVPNTAAESNVATEPVLPSAIASDLADTVAERERAAAAAMPKVEVPKPDAQVAAAAQALEAEPEQVKEAVFDHKSAVAKAEQNKKLKKQGKWILLVVLLLALLGGGAFLIIQAINSANFAETKTRTSALHLAAAKFGDGSEENSCTYIAQNYTDTKIGAETFNSYAENCREDISAMEKAMKAAEGDAGIRKDSNLNGKWQAFKQTYDSLMPKIAEKIDFYVAMHNFLIEKDEIDLFSDSEKGLKRLEEISAPLKESGDETAVKFGTEITEKAKAMTDGYNKLIAAEKVLLDKYGSIEAARGDAAYADYTAAQQAYNTAMENYGALAESVLKGNGNDSETLKLGESLYDQAGALKTTANNR